jgi:hypothetical protein
VFIFCCTRFYGGLRIFESMVFVISYVERPLSPN